MSTILSLSLSLVSVVPAVASVETQVVKKKCDQAALARHNAYKDASRATVAAYKTVIDAAQVTYRAAQQSGITSVRKAAKANYEAALANALNTRAAALSALGSAPSVPEGCKKADLHS
jgi:hypothetical protein